MNKPQNTEIKVGVFITIGMGLVLAAILFLGGNESLFSRKVHYKAKFTNVNGLIVGAKVILGGVPVGTVDDIYFNPKEKKYVSVSMSVLKSSEAWIRTDSTVEIATQGVLGDKYLNLSIGSETEALLPPGSEISVQDGKDLSQFLSKGDQLMVSLNAIARSLDKILKSFETENRSEIFFKGMARTAKNLAESSDSLKAELDHIQLKKTIGHLSGIMEKIDNGTGTIGALVNDASLYDEFKSLMGGVNRNRIVRNLVRQAIKDKDSQKQ